MTGAWAPAERFLRVGELLDLDDRNGAPCLGAFDRVAEARKWYCGLQEVPLAQARPCGGCGRGTITLIGGIPLHLGCPDPPAGWVPAPAPAPSWLAAARQDESPGSPGGAHGGAAGREAEAGPAGEPALAAGAESAAQAGDGGEAEEAEQLAAVLAGDGLWLAGAAAPVAVPWPRDVGQAWELADRFRVRQLWIHPTAHEALGLPAEHGPNPQAPEEHPWAQAAGYTCDPAGLAVWMNLAPAGGGRRRAVVLAGYEHRAAWANAPSGRVLADAVAALAGALPPRCNYYYSPNKTAEAVIFHHHRKGLQPARMPPPAVQRVVTHVGSWSRPPADEEAELRWLHRYDLHGAQLATWSVKLGVGDPVHDPDPQWVPRTRTAGYWLASLPGEWRPDMRLPNLLRPWERARQQQVWVPTPFLELLIENAKAPVILHEAWTWPRSSAWLERSGHSLRDARAALLAQSDGCGKCAPCIALRVVKDVYTSETGNFARRRRASEAEADGGGAAPAAEPQGGGGLVASDNPLQREDVNDHIISKSLCNGWRTYARVGAATNRWPLAIFSDAVYYASDDPDGPRAIPAGMAIGPGLGQYSHEATVLLGAVRGELGEPTFHRAVERYLRAERGRR